MILLPLCDHFRENICEIAGCRLTVAHFTSWTVEYLQAFQLIELQTFRSELRYTPEELDERAGRPGFEGLLLYAEADAIGSLLVYRCLEPMAGDLYLDTIAVVPAGQGLGTLLLKLLIAGARDANCTGLVLDTEQTNELGFQLAAYYQRLGFAVRENDTASGNLSLRLDFSLSVDKPASLIKAASRTREN